MLIAPLVMGAIASRPSWQHIPLAAAWLCGYCAFYACGLAVKSRRFARYAPPIFVYGALALILVAAVMSSAPLLVAWGVLFLPLVAVSLYASYRRADRSVWNDAITVVAACAMTLVSAWVGLAPNAVWWSVIGSQPFAPARLAAVVLFAYFFGTVLYVKTMIRERGNRIVYAASVGYHLALVAAACLAAYAATTTGGAAGTPAAPAPAAIATATITAPAATTAPTTSPGTAPGTSPATTSPGRASPAATTSPGTAPGTSPGTAPGTASPAAITTAAMRRSWAPFDFPVPASDSGPVPWGWALAVVAGALALRAALVPRFSPQASPKQLGIGEIIATLAVCAALVAYI